MTGTKKIEDQINVDLIIAELRLLLLRKKVEAATYIVLMKEENG